MQKSSGPHYLLTSLDLDRQTQQGPRPKGADNSRALARIVETEYRPIWRPRIEVERQLRSCSAQRLPVIRLESFRKSLKEWSAHESVLSRIAGLTRRSVTIDVELRRRASLGP